MEFKLVEQPEHHFRLFDLAGDVKGIAQTIDGYENIPLVTLEEAIEPIVIFIPAVKEMVKLVKGKCQQPKDHLSIDESASIMLYTMECTPKEDSFYYIFNRKLNADDEDDLIPWYSYLKLLSTSVAKLPISSTRIFYRGMKLDLHTNYCINQIFFWHGFSSCVSSIELLDQDELCFGRTGIRTLFIIHSTQGKHISQHSLYKTPHEILLPYGQQFHVVAKRMSKENLCIIILKEFPFYDCDETISTSMINGPMDKTFDLLFQRRIKKHAESCEINLRNQNLMDHHMKSIVTYAIQQKQCTWLSLQKNQITSLGLSILADGLGMNESLESLYLSQNSITDVGVKHLAKSLTNQYSNLTILSLNHNYIKDQGAQYLADMLKTNRVLTDLWLSHNQIGDQGARALVDVLTSHNQTLMQLYLYNNELITGVHIDSFVRMLTINTTLNTFWLQDCSLSSANKEKLEENSLDKKNFDLNV